jgi:hypothetical protein
MRARAASARAPRAPKKIHQPSKDIIILYGTTYSEYAKFWSVPPLFLEDEDIFQKSATLLQLLFKFRVVPTWPIFELHR